MKDRLGHGSDPDPFGKHRAEPSTALPTISKVFTRSRGRSLEHCVSVKNGSNVRIHAFLDPAKAASFAREGNLALIRKVMK